MGLRGDCARRRNGSNSRAGYGREQCNRPRRCSKCRNRESKRAGKTGPEGRYEISNLAPGLYSLRVECPGFKAFARNLAVRAGSEPQTVDAVLEIGATGSTIEVYAIQPAINTPVSPVSRNPRRFLGIFPRR
ncbi:MAG: carboxypeptidase-like regulatory domain-containing protein [Bryobacteraceae bacterium]